MDKGWISAATFIWLAVRKRVINASEIWQQPKSGTKSQFSCDSAETKSPQKLRFLFTLRSSWHILVLSLIQGRACLCRKAFFSSSLKKWPVPSDCHSLMTRVRHNVLNAAYLSCCYKSLLRPRVLFFPWYFPSSLRSQTEQRRWRRLNSTWVCGADIKHTSPPQDD